MQSFVNVHLLEQNPLKHTFQNLVLFSFFNIRFSLFMFWLFFPNFVFRSDFLFCDFLFIFTHFSSVGFRLFIFTVRFFRTLIFLFMGFCSEFFNFRFSILHDDSNKYKANWQSPITQKKCHKYWIKIRLWSLKHQKKSWKHQRTPQRIHDFTR